jgi:transposase-like protein
LANIIKEELKWHDEIIIIMISFLLLYGLRLKNISNNKSKDSC